MRAIPQPPQMQQMVPMQQPTYQQPAVGQAPMILVRTPTGQMGWVPASAVGAAPGQPVAGKPGGSMIKTVLTVGALGLVGWWAYKKWGHHLLLDGGGYDRDRDEDDYAMAERGGYERSRRRKRSRSRLLSEFKQFLDHHEAGEGRSSHSSRERDYDAHEDAHEAEEE